MKNIFFLFMFAIIFASCNNDNIRVAGVVENGCLSDGDSVYLMQPDGNNVAKIKGRAVVRNGHFGEGWGFGLLAIITLIDT